MMFLTILIYLLLYFILIDINLNDIFSILYFLKLDMQNTGVLMKMLYSVSQFKNRKIWILMLMGRKGVDYPAFDISINILNLYHHYNNYHSSSYLIKFIKIHQLLTKFNTT